MADFWIHFWAVCVGLFVAAFAMAWRVTRGPGRRPLGPVARLRHPALVEGVVDEVDDEAHLVRVRYEVGDVRYEIEAHFRTEDRTYAADTRYSWSLDMNVGCDWHDYHTTSLGDVWVGGPIDVRYRPDDPADAVVVPNPHGPYSRRKKDVRARDAHTPDGRCQP